MRNSVGTVTNTFSSAKWANRFLKSAIIQGAAITLLTVMFVSIQLLFSSTVNIVQLLSLSFEGPAKSIFSAVLVISLIAGGLTFLANYSDKMKNVEYIKTKDNTEHTENVNY